MNTPGTSFKRGSEPPDEGASCFSPKVLEALRSAGWTPGRDLPSIEDEYAIALAGRWLPNAGSFVRRFGHLSICHLLWVLPIKTVDVIDVFERIESVVGLRCCPVASSNYMGDGCTVWIDEKGRFYVIDSEGMVFVGERVETALDVLLCGAKPPPAPIEIKAALEGAYEWPNSSE